MVHGWALICTIFLTLITRYYGKWLVYKRSPGSCAGCAGKKISIRKAAAAHGVPKSTLYDYASGKVEIGSRPGPDTILTAAEELKIVEYIKNMSIIGYGRTKEQVSNIVKDMLKKDGRLNPFKRGCTV